MGRELVGSVLAAADAAPPGDNRAGLVVAVTLGAVVLVAFWRVVLLLVLVALVSLVLLGSLTVTGAVDDRGYAPAPAPLTARSEEGPS